MGLPGVVVRVSLPFFAAPLPPPGLWLVTDVDGPDLMMRYDPRRPYEPPLLNRWTCFQS
jgi:hypothetical protein